MVSKCRRPHISMVSHRMSHTVQSQHRRLGPRILCFSIAISYHKVAGYADFFIELRSRALVRLGMLYTAGHPWALPGLGISLEMWTIPDVGNIHDTCEQSCSGSGGSSSV